LLALQMSPANYLAFVKLTRLVAVQHGVASILAPNAFAQEWLEARLSALIKKTLRQVAGQDLAIEVLSPDGPDAAESSPAPAEPVRANLPAERGEEGANPTRNGRSLPSRPRRGRPRKAQAPSLFSPQSPS
jgi:chromosomal replication initiation ATPase DnaA